VEADDLFTAQTLSFNLSGGMITAADGSQVGTTTQADLKEPTWLGVGRLRWRTLRGSQLSVWTPDGELAWAVQQSGRATWPRTRPTRFWGWTERDGRFGYVRWPYVYLDDALVANITMPPRTIGWQRKQIVDRSTAMELARYDQGQITFAPDASQNERILCVAAMYADWRRNLESGD
jgi:hypothetical protein